MRKRHDGDYGYLSLALDTSLAFLLAGSFFIGIANGVGVPYLNTIASIKGGKDAATSVMPLLSVALYLGQFVSPLIVNPLSRWVVTMAATPVGILTSPYTVGVGIGILFLIQTFATRRYHALSPVSREHGML